MLQRVVISGLTVAASGRRERVISCGRYCERGVRQLPLVVVGDHRSEVNGCDDSFSLQYECGTCNVEPGSFLGIHGERPRFGLATGRERDAANGANTGYIHYGVDDVRGIDAGAAIAEAKSLGRNESAAGDGALRKCLRPPFRTPASSATRVQESTARSGRRSPAGSEPASRRRLSTGPISSAICTWIICGSST